MSPINFYGYAVLGIAILVFIAWLFIVTLPHSIIIGTVLWATAILEHIRRSL